MNLYSNLVAIKDSLAISGTDDDTRLLALLESASRIIDNETKRHFYVEAETRYFDGAVPLRVDDLLSIDTLGLSTDDDGDATFENTFATTDYILYPMNIYPKTKIELSVDSDYRSFGHRVRGCEIAGLWGYGDGVSAAPYSSSGDTTGDNLSDTATSCDVTDADNFSPGQTILLSSEQCYISGYDTTGNTITLVRGINGTTAVGHNAGTGIYIWEYPADIEQTCLSLAEKLFVTRGKGFQSETLGDYSYTMAKSSIPEPEKTVLMPFVSLRV